MLRSFDYRALDAAGADVRGRVQAEGDVQALRAVAAQGLTPLEVVEAGATGTRAPGPVVRRVKAAEVAQLLQELATLLKGGVALGEALPSLAQAYRSTGLETPLAGIDQAVRSGQHLSEAVKQAGLPLPRYALAVIESGEASGQMAGALEDIHQQMAYDAAVRQEMRNALTYPAILVIAGLAAILSQLAREDRLCVVDTFTVDSPKTRLLAEKVREMGFDDVLIVTDQLDENLFLSSRNLSYVGVLRVEQTDPLSLLQFDKVLFTRNAIARIEEILK